MDNLNGQILINWWLSKGQFDRKHSGYLGSSICRIRQCNAVPKGCTNCFYIVPEDMLIKLNKLLEIVDETNQP
jgi:hypothetical protein